MSTADLQVYVTFGQGHVHAHEGEIYDKDCVALVTGHSEEAVRAYLYEHFDNRYCTTYTSAESVARALSYCPRGVIPLHL